MNDEELPKSYDVHHNIADSQFEINLSTDGGNPQFAIAKYTMCSVGQQPSEEGAAAAAAVASDRLCVLDLHHTEVPAMGRGKGVAGQLLDAVFRHAQEVGLAVRPSCSYARDTWLPRHPEYRAVCESELVTPVCVERTVPSAAEAAAVMEGGEDEGEDEEWDDKALLKMQDHTFRLARNQYQADLAEIGFGTKDDTGVRIRTLIRLGQLLLNRVLELLPISSDDSNVEAEIKQHVRDAHAVAVQIEELVGTQTGEAAAQSPVANERTLEHKRFLATLSEADRLL